jgi:hypothetical protein
VTKTEIIDVLVGAAMLTVADCWEVLGITSCDDCPKMADCRIKQAMEESKDL